MCQKASVLIVDDEPPICELISRSLRKNDYMCATALTASEALAVLSMHRFDAVLLDIMLPDMSGTEVLRRVRLEQPDVVAVVVTAVEDVRTAVEVMKLGAADYIMKPFKLDRIDACLHSALSRPCVWPGFGSFMYPSPPEDNNRESLVGCFRQMNAIAHGVEAGLDTLHEHSSTVTRRTLEVAIDLGIPAKAVCKWAVARGRLFSVKERHACCSALLMKEHEKLASGLTPATEIYQYSGKGVKIAPVPASTRCSRCVALSSTGKDLCDFSDSLS